MRMDSLKLTLSVLLFSAITGLVFSASVLGQSNANNKLPQVDPHPHSPLSQYSKLDQLIESPARRALVIRGDEEKLITKEVDLRATLKRYAAYKKCSLDQAFADTVAYLKMVPLQESEAKRVVGTQAYYSIVEKDIYRITAPTKFFNRLKENLLCLEHGKRYMQLEVHFLHVSPKQIEQLQNFMMPGSYVAFNNKFPEMVPYATQASYEDSAKWRGKKSKANGTFVVASETKTKIYPTFLGRLNDDGARRMLSTFNKDTDSEILLAPRIKVIPGQTATVTDAATRPYVIGVNRIEGDFTVAHQPIVQSVEDGIILKLRSIDEDGKIRLDGDLALCEISSVGTFKLPTPQGKKENPVTVQVPEQKVKQVHWSTLIQEGETLLIDPVFEAKTFGEPVAKGKKVFVNKTRRVLVMIKPRFVESLSALTR